MIFLGYSMNYSKNGRTVAVGAKTYVRVYVYGPDTNRRIQKGPDLDGGVVLVPPFY